MNDSIIVYRNPAEKAFWEGGYFLPMVGFFLAALFVFFVTYQFLKWVTGKYIREPQWFAWVAGIIGVTAGFFSFHWVWVFTH